MLTLACATCKADPNSVIAQAQDIAVLVMLAFLALGMSFVGLIVWNFVRKQQRVVVTA